jgi:hypothetical protein
MEKICLRISEFNHNLTEQTELEHTEKAQNQNSQDDEDEDEQGDSVVFGKQNESTRIYECCIYYSF